MKFTAKTISLISTFANIALSAAKLISGFAFGSIALIASGIDSSLDIVSSVVTFFGIKISEKPADKEHPYGHARYESLASYTIVLIIFASTLWILYEAIADLFKKGTNFEYSVISVIIIIAAIIITEVLARLKYYFGNKFSSLSLVADAQHSRADVLSQVAVLAGLVVSKYFSIADNIFAIFVSVYVLWSTYHLAKESVDSLVDKSNEELEKRIGVWLESNNYKFSQIKTRKIGNNNYAEIFLILSSNLKTEEITSIIGALEQKILNNFHELTQITLSIDSHKISESFARNWFGGRMHFRFSKFSEDKKIIEPKNEGAERILIPYANNDIAPDFGSKEYFLVELSENNEILKKKIISNPFYNEGEKFGHGVRFIRSVNTDRVLTKSIGQGAKNNLESQGIKVIIISKEINLKNLEEKNYETEKISKN